MNLRHLYSFQFIFLIFTFNLVSSPIDSTLTNKLQLTLDSIRIAEQIRGISASIYLPGQGEWKGCSGFSHQNNPITPDMEFGIGSNTKLFTAITALILQENGLLSLNDSIKKWIAALHNIDSNITIQQLLNHTSGVADFINVHGYPDSILTNPNRVFEPEEVLSWVGYPLFTPGHGWSYSNSNYVLAGLIVENASGINAAKFIRDSILSRINLDSTFFEVQETVQGVVAHAWQNGVDISTRPRTSAYSAAWTAGAIFSTASELMQFYKAIFDGNILTENSLHELTEFTGPQKYGLGIAQQVVNGRVVWGHGGSIQGYRSRIAYDTVSKAIISFISNSNPTDVDAVLESLMLTLFENYPVDISENISEQPITNFRISQNFPNPFNASTIIEYSGASESIDIKIFNCLGQMVYSRIVLTTQVGAQRILLELTDFTSGVYIYEISDGKTTERKKMILMK